MLPFVPLLLVPQGIVLFAVLATVIVGGFAYLGRGDSLVCGL
jgi:hypothetical protein